MLPPLPRLSLPVFMLVRVLPLVLFVLAPAFCRLPFAVFGVVAFKGSSRSLGIGRRPEDHGRRQRKRRGAHQLRGQVREMGRGSGDGNRLEVSRVRTRKTGMRVELGEVSWPSVPCRMQRRVIDLPPFIAQRPSDKTFPQSCNHVGNAASPLYIVAIFFKARVHRRW